MAEAFMITDGKETVRQEAFEKHNGKELHNQSFQPTW
jgi:hypothetical protein